MSDSDISSLVQFIQAELPLDSWKPWPGGWPDQVEAALIDAVLSIAAQYGSPENGVRGAVSRYREAVGTDRPDDLARLAAYAPEDLQVILNNQRVSGRTKASVIIEAATNLLAAGVKSGADLNPKDPAQKRAYTSVHGLGPVTWDYFGMLLGKPGVKADRWILRFVSRGLGRDLTSAEARSLLLDVASRLDATPTALDHAIWAHERELQIPEREETL